MQKCELCGNTLKLRTKWTGDKKGLRYWVCSDFPTCKYQKGYAEQGNNNPWKWFLSKGKFAYKQIKNKP